MIYYWSKHANSRVAEENNLENKCLYPLSNFIHYSREPGYHGKPDSYKNKIVPPIIFIMNRSPPSLPDLKSARKFLFAVHPFVERLPGIYNGRNLVTLCKWNDA